MGPSHLLGILSTLKPKQGLKRGIIYRGNGQENGNYRDYRDFTGYSMLGLYELLSKLLVYPLISPRVVPYIIPYITPFKEFRL